MVVLILGLMERDTHPPPHQPISLWGDPKVAVIKTISEHQKQRMRMATEMTNLLHTSYK